MSRDAHRIQIFIYFLNLTILFCNRQRVLVILFSTSWNDSAEIERLKNDESLFVKKKKRWMAEHANISTI